MTKPFAKPAALLAAALFGLLLVSALFAATLWAGGPPADLFVVANLEDDGPGSLRQAILSANTAGGTILFDPGLSGGAITLQSELPAISASIAVTAPIGGITLQMGAAPVSGWRHLRIGNDAQPALEVTLENLRFVGPGGSAQAGVENGGILCGGAASTILGDYDISPHMEGLLTMRNCEVSGTQNHTVGLITGGGAVAMLGKNSTLAVQNCVFQENRAYSYGGGVLSMGLVTAAASTIADNEARMHGGGLFVDGTAAMDRCTLSGNTAAETGGGATIKTASLLNCTGANNRGGSVGGGLRVGTAQLTNCTVTGNQNLGESVGGAGLDAYTSLDMNGCILSANYDLLGFLREISVGSTPNLYSGSGQVEDVYGLRNFIGVPGAGLLVRPTLENLQTVLAAGLNPRGLPVGLLADNGGPTQTVLITRGGPTQNAIAAASYPDLPATDQRGVLRPQGTLWDIGALELEDPPDSSSSSSDSSSSSSSFSSSVSSSDVSSTASVSIFSSPDSISSSLSSSPVSSVSGASSSLSQHPAASATATSVAGGAGGATPQTGDGDPTAFAATAALCALASIAFIVLAFKQPSGHK